MPIPRPAKQPCVYILASKRDGVLYVGVTSGLAQRVGLHKQDLIEGFTKRYGVHTLAYYEMHETMPAAIRREKQLKKWNRAWKVRLIEQLNPQWNDLWLETGEVLMSGIGGQELPGENMERAYRFGVDARLRGHDVKYQCHGGRVGVRAGILR